jgi:hypothetical protein
VIELIIPLLERNSGVTLGALADAKSARAALSITGERMSRNNAEASPAQIRAPHR